MSRPDPLGDLLVSVRASAEQFSADMKKVEASSFKTTNAIVTSWGKSGDAASAAVQRMEQRAASKTIAREFDTTTSGIVKGWAKTGDSAKDAAAKTERSFDQAGSALKSIEQMLGVQLPNAAGKFLEKSSTIGPILTGAFSAIAVVGLIQALSELPALFDKLVAAISGWDEAAKKAYANFLDENRKAVSAAEEFRLKLIEIRFGGVASLTSAIEAQTEENRRNLGTVAALNAELTKQQQIVDELAKEGILGAVPAFSQEQRDQLAAAEKAAQEGGKKLLALRRELAKGEERVAKESADKQLKIAEDASRKAAEIRARGVPMIRSGEAAQARGPHPWFDVDQAARDAAGVVDQLRKAEEQRFRVGQETNAAIQKELETVTDIRVREILRGRAEDDKNWREQMEIDRKRAEDMFNSVKRTAADTFLAIFRDGEFRFKALADSVKGIFATLANEILSTLTAKLLSPIVDKITGALLGRGGGVAGASGNAAFGGLLGGLGAKIGGLFGGGAGGAIGTINPATGALVPAGGGGMGAAMAALASNPITWAAAGGLLAGTAWLKSQAHHEAKTFTDKFQDPLVNTAGTGTLDRILQSSASATDKLKEVEAAWLEFSEAAQRFAQGGKDEALVVKQAFDTLNPLISNVRRDLGESIRTVSPAVQGPVHLTLQLDKRTVARLIIPDLYALTRNEGMQLLGAR